MQTVSVPPVRARSVRALALLLFGAVIAHIAYYTWSSNPETVRTVVPVQDEDDLLQFEPSPGLFDVGDSSELVGQVPGRVGGSVGWGDADEPARPPFRRESLYAFTAAEITALARKSSEINQRSGVSVRISIANYETLVSNALRRAIRLGEKQVVPRISDLPALIASTTGKIEIESVEEGKESQVIERLIRNALLNVFNRYFSVLDLEDFIAKFNSGLTMEVSDSMKAREYVTKVVKAGEIGGLSDKLKELDGGAAAVASTLEFLLEGLHLNRKLNKEKIMGKSLYQA